MIAIQYENFNIDFKLGTSHMEHFSNMRTTACTFDEMRN